jgi:hypothetical protein
MSLRTTNSYPTATWPASAVVPASIMHSPRPAPPARTMEEALSRKQALIAATALPRVTTDMLNPAVGSREPFFFVRDLDRARGGLAADYAPVARAVEIMERPSRMMRSGETEVLEQMDRQERLLERAFGSVAPSPDPVPGLAGSLIHPLPRLGSARPRDEVVAEFQERTTEWLDIVCPKALTCMTAAHDALLRGDEESMAHAVTSCRRALTALADAVEPPAPGTRPDHTGRERKVGRDEYKNRLLIHLGKCATSKSGRKLSIRELELLVHRLDALVDRLGKGVHDDYHYEDAAHIYLTSWAVIGEVVRFSDG